MPKKKAAKGIAAKKVRSKSTIGRTSKAKGSEFERGISRTLSLWWSKGERDDIFYRTNSSGAFATNRAKKGKTTANSAGDISFLDESGAALMKMFSFELKKGYPQAEFQRILDRDPSSKPNILEEWFAQAAESKQHASSYSWAVIHGPHRRASLVYTPLMSLVEMARLVGSKFPVPMAILHNVPDVGSDLIACLRLDGFLQYLEPERVAEYVESKQYTASREAKT